MNRQGFVLLTVLWSLVLLAVAAGVTLSVAQAGFYASRNRLVLGRADWARAACLELLRQRLPGEPTLRRLDTTRVGPTAWCRANITDPASGIDPGRLDSVSLVAVLGDPIRAASLLDWTDADTVAREGGAEQDWYTANDRTPPRNGPIADVRELRLVRGFEGIDTSWLTQRFSVDGSGRLNPNLADATVLAAVPGLGLATSWRLEAQRRLGQPVTSLEQLAAHLSPLQRNALESHWAGLSQQFEFATSHLRAELEGGVEGYPLRARETVLFALLPDRVAIVRRAVW